MLGYARELPGELSRPVLLSYPEPRTFFATSYRHNDSSRMLKLAVSVSDYIQACTQVLGSVRYPVGRIIRKQALQDKHFMLTDALCSPVSRPELERFRVPGRYIRTLPPGQYARLWYRGDPIEPNGAYPLLCQFLLENHLEIAGDGCELWIIDQFSASSAEQSTAVIEIPVHPAESPLPCPV